MNNPWLRGNRTPGSCVAIGCNSAGCASQVLQLIPNNAHVTRGPCSVDRVNGVQREDKNILQCSQLRQHGEFRHVSVSERQRSHLCGQNLCGAFVRAVLATNFKESDWAMAADGTTKALVPSPRWVSAPKLYSEDSAWKRSWWCSQNLCRPAIHVLSPFPPNDVIWHHETFSFMMSHPAMSLGDRLCTSRKGGAGGGIGGCTRRVQTAWLRLGSALNSHWLEPSRPFLGF